jgi:phosphotransacetylase
MYRNFEEISKKAKERGPCRVSILFPDDPDIMRVAVDGMREGLIKPVLVGHSNRIKQIAREANLPLSQIEIREEEDPQEASNLCLNMAKKGEVSFVVKGNILTTYLYKALIKITKKILTDQIPCTLCFHHIPGLEKIFVITDGGVNIHPNLETKKKILANGINVLQRLGCNRPRIMVLATPCILDETSSYSKDAEVLRELSLSGDLGQCEIDFAKNLHEAFPEWTLQAERFPDVFLVPNIETGNILVKSIDHLGIGIRQCVTVGAGIFILTPSRSDGYEARMMNLSLGIVLATS